MTVVGEVLMLLGGVIALLGAVGLLRLQTPYARFHAGGKASPVGFLVAAIGASFFLGASGAGYLLIAIVAMVTTVPVGVHLLFRAVYQNLDQPEGLTEDAESERHRTAPRSSS